MKKCFGYLVVCLWFLSFTSSFLYGQGPEFAPPATRTVVADVLVVEGEFLIVRGELGEIRIVIKPDTEISEKFTFGDRVKAVIRPDDSAISVVRAGAGEPTGIQSGSPVPAEKSPQAEMAPSSPALERGQSPTPDVPPASSVTSGPKTRIIVADLLMVDGDFYVVRDEHGEIRIEATPETKISEKFDFGDRIKAKVLPNDKAIYIKRAKPEDPIGIQVLEPSVPVTDKPASQPEQAMSQPAAPVPERAVAQPTDNTRSIVAEVLMIDGDFIVVRGERGEIRIEVTAETKLSERFKFGDKINATVLPNDRALSVRRAKPDEPIGITQN